jgi:restriction system protein
LGQILKVVASFGQYLIPGALLIGAAVSVFKSWGKSGKSIGFEDVRNDTHWPEESKPFDEAEQARRRREDEMYEYNKSSQTKPSRSAKVDTSRWSAELLNALEWKRFEEVCAGFFECLGFTTKSVLCGADGGIDIRLYLSSSEKAVAIVQCKSWKKTVGVDVVRELRGVMASEGIPEGIFATTNSFTTDAVAFAKANHIDLMDGTKVLNSIRSLTDDQQANLLQLATEGDYTTPTCASCGIKLTWRTPASGAKSFWGCVNYPRCRSRLFLAGPA